MKVLGYYLADYDNQLTGDAVCEDCFNGEPEASEDAPIFYDTEGDTPTHCGECDALIPHSLTEDGYDYVAERLAYSVGRGNVTPIDQEWYETYGDGLMPENLRHIVDAAIGRQ